jgi:DNA-binding response OmpR family regulator
MTWFLIGLAAILIVVIIWEGCRLRRLKGENSRLKARLGGTEAESQTVAGNPVAGIADSATTEKISTDSAEETANNTPIHEEDQRDVLMLVEDEEGTADYLSENLSERFRIIIVKDGTEALSMAPEINPDLIISEVAIHGMNGLDLCRRLKFSVETSHIPIILISAFGANEDVIAGLEAGANDYVTRPFDMAMLKARIRNLLDDRQRLRNSMEKIGGEEKPVEYSSQWDKEFMGKVMKVIEEEMSNSELSINDFCMKLGMSRTAAYNKIKSLTGKGPNDFIQMVRLNRSRELIRTRKYNITEVSEMVGFSSPKYFSTCFKKRFGTSPSKT